MSAESHPVHSAHDRFGLCARAGEFAAGLGFGRGDRARVAVCVAELLTNAVKFAGRGEMRLEALHGGGMRVVVQDEGAGIARPDLAVLDGFSEGGWITPDGVAQPRRGLGVGLGAVLRLGDRVRIERSPRGGARIEVDFYAPGQGLGGTGGGTTGPGGARLR